MRRAKDGTGLNQARRGNGRDRKFGPNRFRGEEAKVPSPANDAYSSSTGAMVKTRAQALGSVPALDGPLCPPGCPETGPQKPRSRGNRWTKLPGSSGAAMGVRHAAIAETQGQDISTETCPAGVHPEEGWTEEAFGDTDFERPNSATSIGVVDGAYL